MAILTDIEGTTSSIAFVKDVLFPFAASHLPDFVRRHAAREDVAALVEETRALAGGSARDLEAVIATLRAWIDEDRKAPPLKALQGMVWAAGYRSGELVGHIYPDAAAALRRWHAAGVHLYVYSSGSVEAQQLLFGHSQAGDLRPLFRGWFDTRIGAKVAPASYAAIAQQIRLPPNAIRFLSDSSAELDAAAAAGLVTVQLVREDEGERSSRHAVARSFAEIEASAP